jgi:uncharacterized coiled-coil DUF342 family protein
MEMLDKLKAKMAEYEQTVLEYENRIHEHEDAIDECGKRISETSAKMELLNEIIKEEESRAGVVVEAKPAIHSANVVMESKTAEVHEDEPIVLHYGSGKMPTN